jgi:hypothetical protein
MERFRKISGRCLAIGVPDRHLDEPVHAVPPIFQVWNVLVICVDVVCHLIMAPFFRSIYVILWCRRLQVNITHLTQAIRITGYDQLDQLL